jgi:hypothetical protein
MPCCRCSVLLGLVCRPYDIMQTIRSDQGEALMLGIDRVCQPHSSIHDPWADTASIVMDRDFRLTGAWREQSDNPVAPVGFEVNNPWRVCVFESKVPIAANIWPDGEKDHLTSKAYARPLLYISFRSHGRNFLFLQERASSAPIVSPTTC